MTEGRTGQTQKEDFPQRKILLALLVRLIGLEPTRRKTPDPKSGASTNFATGAHTPHAEQQKGLTVSIQRSATHFVLQVQSYTFYFDCATENVFFYPHP